MPTLTVYVSDEQQEAIEKWRAQLNLSELARRAIMLEIARLEERAKPQGDLEPLIARLRVQKIEAESGSYHKGFEAGKLAATSWELFDYPAFAVLQENRGWLTDRPEGEGFSYQDVLPESVQELLFSGDLAMFRDGGLFPEGSDLEEWLRGFIEGALSIWDQIRDKI